MIYIVRAGGGEFQLLMINQIRCPSVIKSKLCYYEHLLSDITNTTYNKRIDSRSTRLPLHCYHVFELLYCTVVKSLELALFVRMILPRPECLNALLTGHNSTPWN